MSFGFRAVNDASVLVVDSNSVGYYYLARASLITASSKSATVLTPYLFRVVMPLASDIPIVALLLSDAKVQTVYAVERFTGDGTGRTWNIYVHSVQRFGSGDNPVPSQPDVLVFAPMSSITGGMGVKLLKPDGVTVAWNFSERPFWIRQAIAYSAHSGLGAGGFYNGDVQSRDTGIAAPAVVGAANGTYSCIQDTSGEYLFEGTYGWYVEGSTLARRQIWLRSDRPFDSVQPEDTIFFDMVAVRPLFISSTGLS